MRRRSSLTFQKIEQRSKCLLQRMACITATVRISACLMCFLVAKHLDPLDEPFWIPLLFSFTCFTFVGCGLRIFDRTFRWVRYLLLFEIFYVQIIGYYSKVLVLVEYLFIPLALLDISLMFPITAAIPMEICMGMIAVPFMSYSFQAHAEIMLSGKTIPLFMLSFPYFAGYSCVSVLVALVITHQKQILAAHDTEVRINQNLDAINRALSTQMFLIKSESERTAKMQVTKDVHDNAGYVFTNLLMMLQATEAVYDRDPVKAKSMLANCVEYSCQGMNEIRGILRTIRQTEQPSIHIQKETNDLIRLFSRCTGTQVTIEYGNWPQSFSPPIDSFLLSFVKEMLTNALKHGMASRIRITCWLGNHDLSMTVQDNGMGHQGDIDFGIGLQSIYDAAIKLKGKLNVQPQAHGFLVRIQLPLLLRE